MIAVTGATGHLGRLVVESLLERGTPADQVVAAVRTPAKAADLAARGVQVREADYSRPETLAAAFEGVDTLLLVSSSEVGQRVPQHVAVIDAAKAAGVGRVVYTSAPQADTSTLVLAPDHKATEEYLAQSGLATTILRNNWYTENYLQPVQQAKDSGEILASVGDGKVASAPRSDFAEAAAVVLVDDSHAGKVYELSGDVAWTHDELAAAAGEVLGREVSYHRVSPEEHAAVLAGFGLDEGTVGFVVALDGNIRDGELATVTSDLSTLLGRPTTGLVEALRAAL
ncbi:SDR family oxidoreductase [Sanguibacter sp. 4.1]|uniref:SDR family oxidoreductase n=1 Tax=Sanguibacter biliveldensis TaxID=3030830 RepID=A0AAF0Z203_9MICO|nr:SDR family oxidoreductase [Sanguibacter sp. 4.1]WPF81387.1 SDR family oxidoreductase [Sanguibacter sp. 4.1]